jgi:hypothetical protein
VRALAADTAFLLERLQHKGGGGGGGVRALAADTTFPLERLLHWA